MLIFYSILLQQKEGSAQGGSSKGTCRWSRQGPHWQEVASSPRVCFASQKAQGSGETQQSQECLEGMFIAPCDF